MGLIRLLLASSVVVDHSTPLWGQALVGGRTAVECFFVISGFYMALVINHKYSRAPRPWRTFIGARITRLYPTYLVVLFASALVLGLHAVRHDGFPLLVEAGSLSPLGLLGVIAANLTMLGQDLLTFLVVDPSGGWHVTRDLRQEIHSGELLLAVPQTWSISLELVFYALAPALVALRARWLALIALASVVLRAGLVTAGFDHDPWSYRLFPTELLYFLAGVFVYKVDPLGRWRGARWRGPAALASVVILLLSYETLIGAYGPVVFLYPLLMAIGVPAIFLWSKNFHVDRQVGELSYAVYLVHLLVLSALKFVGLPLQGWLLLPASILAAIGIYVAVEAPVERLRQQRIDRALSAGQPTVVPAEQPATARSAQVPDASAGEGLRATAHIE